MKASSEKLLALQRFVIKSLKVIKLKFIKIFNLKLDKFQGQWGCGPRSEETIIGRRISVLGEIQNTHLSLSKESAETARAET